MLWSAEEMLDGQHQRVDIPAYARTVHKGRLQKTLALCYQKKNKKRCLLDLDNSIALAPVTTRDRNDGGAFSFRHQRKL